MREFNVVVLGGANDTHSQGHLLIYTCIPAGGVGKSALTVRFVRDIFIENYDPTIEGTLGP
jgi:hypothetical protein